MEIETTGVAFDGNRDLEKGVISNGGDDEGAATLSSPAANAAYLVWEDLTVVVPNFGSGPTRRIINGLNGFAQPGRIMAIMGPSGSGKSTFLDSLAGRINGNLILTGNVLLNGRKMKQDYGRLAYVTQEDVLLGTLTARETITYSAHLRLPKNMTKGEVNGIVEATITEMGLQDCADRLIGNWHLRGISGGEKKRLSISLEVLTRPHLLFLDEPTSGLDSAASFFVVQALRNVAGGRRTIICSIHQPSSEVFALFDDLFLLSGGETVYFGEVKMSVQFFTDAGFPCPTRRNPAEHFLHCINSDFDNVKDTLEGSHRLLDVEKSTTPLMNMKTAEIRVQLIQKYRCSKYATKARERITEISTIEGLAVKTREGSQTSWGKQLLTLTKRSFVNMSRDIGYYWLRIVVYIAVSICVGSVFFDIGTGYNAILARGACGGFISGYMSFMSIGGFPSFIEEMKIFHRERLNGYYGVSAFILSNFFSSLPFLVIMTLSTLAIIYNMVKFRPGFYHFLYAWLDLLFSIAVVESCMMVVASVVPNFLMGVIVGAGVIGIMMMSSGFFRLLAALPKPIWRYPLYYINYMSYAIQGAYKNDMLGLDFDPQQPGDPKLKGEHVIENMLGVPVVRSKWWDLVAVIAILIFYRLLFIAILKFKERVWPILRALYVKRTLKQLNERPSFRRTPTFSSKRHQTVHSLSSQEGLNSPIHYN